MPSLRLRLLMPLLALIVAGAVGGAAAVQRSTASTAAQRTQSADRLLTAMLDQETGLRGYLLTDRREFLAPYENGRLDYDRALAQARSRVTAGSPAARELARADRIARAWQALAENEVTQVQAGRSRVAIPAALQRKHAMDAFRAADAALLAKFDETRVTDERLAQWLSIGIALFVFLLVGGIGTWLISRRLRAEAALEAAERAFRDGQAEFVGTLQSVDDEEEANLVLMRHLERWIPDREVTVLNRNNSDNRLEARAGAATEIAEKLKDVEPRACVAIRLGRAHEERDGQTPLLQCELCGRRAGESLCSPLLVSGRVIGSVLVRQQQTLKRMVAQSHRFERPLAAIAIDLDHFKQVNDRFGHDKGDEVLATVSAVLMNTIRASDFAGRMGGEEFLVLAPDTHPGGALVLAEKLRQAISRVEIPGAGHVTASFGVASVPEDAVDPDTLMRRADRALYAAKEHGRDRVEAAAGATRT